MISNDFQIFHDIPMKEILETCSGSARFAGGAELAIVGCIPPNPP